MVMNIEELEPKNLFRHFAALTRIPRGSGNEDGAREYVRAWAREHGFDTRIDGAGNILVAVPASPGHEAAPVVVLQGHLDMVCERAPDTNIAFSRDPIPAYVDGDTVRARGTTLGADNGIGVAAALAVAEDSDCIHGPLEVLCTVDEETGLTGASNLSGSMVRGRILLNLDSEDEGTIFIGCAGGGDTTITLALKRGPADPDTVALDCAVSGLKGGHSGLDIARGRGNAIRLLARAIHFGLADHSGWRIASITGGTKRNAIPREASACISVPTRLAGTFTQALQEFASVIKSELGANDPDVRVVVSEATHAPDPFSAEDSIRLLRLLLALPHGPLAMSTDIPGLVETSSNLAQVDCKGEIVKVLCNTRSALGSALDAVRLGIKACGELAGGQVTISDRYPGWRPNMQSPVLAKARHVWKELTGQEAIVTAVHAGLECGVIGERVPGMDMVSIGPDIRGAHSPDEHVSIPSVARFYDYLKALLRSLAL